MDATSDTKTATLTVGNKTYDFPILTGTVGPDVIDIAKLYGQSGMFTYDPASLPPPAASPGSPISMATPGFSNTAATRSSSWRKKAIS